MNLKVCEVLPSGWSFEKSVITPGAGETNPSDCATCRVSFSNIDEGLNNVLQHHSVLEKEIYTIGDFDNEVTELLDVCLQTMTEKEVSVVTVQDISDPPQSFSFNICLEELNATPPFHMLSSEEKLANALYHKDKGTDLYKASNVEYAFRHYSLATKYMICASDLEVPDLKTLLSCYLNLAACQLKFQNYPHVIENCSKALALDNTNIKGLYRRANAYASSDLLEEAIEDYMAIKEHEPTNKQVQRELNAVIQRRKQRDDLIGSRLKGMFM